MDSLQVSICGIPVTTLSSAKDFPIWQHQLRTAILAEDPKIWDVLTGNLKAPNSHVLTPTSMPEVINDQLASGKPMQDISHPQRQERMTEDTGEKNRHDEEWQSLNMKAVSLINQTIASSVKESLKLTPPNSAFEIYSAICKPFGTTNILTAAEAWERLKKCKYLPNSTPGLSSHAFVTEWKKALADFMKLAQDNSSSEKPLPQLSAYIMFLDAVGNNPQTESWLRVHRFSPYNRDVLKAVYEDFLKGERRRELQG
ncbi:hypothetical protein N7493_004474 [Penicillium malachiteum]|uniref:Uncharacterized protein n=1 Tax=Penicillium malachiteum TaxID=1324776 RepID=A0AAD6MX16_9EURO|nr:hypothetical protein N7493_004474 [Penicillium malachiteum]